MNASPLNRCLTYGAIALGALVASAGCAGSSSGACGGAGQACCNGTACNSGLTCQAGVCAPAAGSSGTGGRASSGGTTSAGSSGGAQTSTGSSGGASTGGSTAAGTSGASTGAGNSATGGTGSSGGASSGGGFGCGVGYPPQGPLVDAGCPGGEAFCDGGCVDDLTDSNNCGACGFSCGGLTCCGGFCTSTTGDSANCGGCGLACPAGQGCSLTCKCFGTLCGSACVGTATDPANCGGCGVACDAGLSCLSGQCVQPAGDGGCPAGCGPGSACVGSTCTRVLFAADAGNVEIVALAPGPTALYAAAWTSNIGPLGGGVIESLSLGGGATQTLLTTQLSPNALAAGQSDLFWIGFSPAAGENAVGEMPLAGGDPVAVDCGLPSGAGVVAIDPANVYYGVANELWQRDLAGAAPPVLLYAGDGGAGGPPFVNGVAVATGEVVWTQVGHPSSSAPFTGQVLAVPIGGGTPVVLFDGADAGLEPHALVAQGSRVFALMESSNWAPCSIVEVDLTTGGVSTLISGLGYAGGLAVDSTGIYWSDTKVIPSPSTIETLPFGSDGGPTTLVSGAVGQIPVLTVDATNLYWVGGYPSPSVVYEIPK